MDPEFADRLKELEPGTGASDEAGPEAIYRSRFRTIRRNETIATIVVAILGIALLSLLVASTGTNLLALGRLGSYLILTAIAFAGASIFRVANWRCPRCGKYLGQATSLLRMYWPDVTIRSCPYCGLRLQ